MNVRELIKALSDYVDTLPCEVVLEEIGIDVRVPRTDPSYMGQPLSGNESVDG